MILIIESTLIIVLTGLNLFQYRRNRELLKGISVVTEHVDQEYDTFILSYIVRMIWRSRI